MGLQDKLVTFLLAEADKLNQQQPGDEFGLDDTLVRRMLTAAVAKLSFQECVAYDANLQLRPALDLVPRQVRPSGLSRQLSGLSRQMEQLRCCGRIGVCVATVLRSHWCVCCLP